MADNYINLPVSGGTSGSGGDGQVAYWNGSTSLTGDSGLTYTPTMLTVGSDDSAQIILGSTSLNSNNGDLEIPSLKVDTSGTAIKLVNGALIDFGNGAIAGGSGSNQLGLTGSIATINAGNNISTLGIGSLIQTEGDINNVAMGGGATGVAPSLTMSGGDTNIGLTIAMQRNGALTITGPGTGHDAIAIPSGSILDLGSTVTLQATAGPTLSMNSGVTVSCGPVRSFGGVFTVGNTQHFGTLGSGSLFETIGDTNNIAMGGATTTNNPHLTMSGSDTNIGLAIALKGTGNGGVVITGPGSTNKAITIPPQSVIDLSGGATACTLVYGFDGNCGINTGLDLFGGINMTANGAKIAITDDSSSSSSIGQAQLASGAVTVSTTAVAAGSRIFLTHAGTGTTANFGTPYVGTITPGTSFVIHSTNASDNDKINWWIIS